jgi:hypothetical protein
MKINVDYIEETDTVDVSFYRDEFESDRDKQLCLNIIFTFAHNFDLEPEMEVETIDEILSAIDEEGKKEFTFSFSEDGVEVDLK